MSLTPKCWHLYVVDLEPRTGTKPGKQRPCLAIQPSEFVASGLKSTVILPLTTKVIRNANAYPLRVKIPSGTSGIDQESEIIIDQILAWDNSLFRKEIGYLPEAIQDEVKRALVDFLDLSLS